MASTPELPPELIEKLRKIDPRKASPAVQALLAAAPLAIGAAALAWRWWSRRPSSRHAGRNWVVELLTAPDLPVARHEVLKYVRDALLGHSRRGIREMLGPPSAAGDEGVVFDEPDDPRSQVSGRWFYRLGRAGPGSGALVVEFEDDEACDATFVVPPDR